MNQHTPNTPPEPTPESRAEPATAPPLGSMTLARPTLWSRRMKMAGVALLGALIWFNEAILATLRAPDTPTDMLVMVVAPPLLFVLWLLWRVWDTPKTARSIEFGPDAVVLPLSKNTKRSVTLRYEDLHGILSMSRATSNAALIDTGEVTLGYEDSDFAPLHQPNASKKLNAELNRRVRQLPTSKEVQARMRARFEVGHAASSNSTPVTLALLGVLGVYFGVEILTGALNEPFGLIRLGANAPALVEEGQYWRLISANFLHGGWVHLFFNGMALYFLGVSVEKLLGSWRLLLIYMTTAIAGSMGSWWLGQAALSVGSSTAIFGLFGAFLAIHLRYWSQLPPPFRQAKRWWVVIIAINGGLPFLVPAIDYAAHVAGLASGLLLTLALLRGAPALDPERPASKMVTALAGGVSALTVAGLIFAGIYAFQPSPHDAEKVFARLYDQAQSAANAPDQINEISWMIAIDPKSEKPRVLMARDALTEITDLKSGRVELRDTLATLEYRLARLSADDARVDAINRAIAIHIGLLTQPDGGTIDASLRVFFGAQLARFLDYRQVIGEPNDPDGFVRGPLEVKVDQDEKILRFVGLGSVPHDSAVYILVKRDGDLYGLLKGCLLRGAYAPDNPSFGVSTLYQEFKADEALAFEPALIREDATCRRQGEGADKDEVDLHQSPEFWPLTQEVRELP